MYRQQFSYLLIVLLFACSPESRTFTNLAQIDNDGDGIGFLGDCNDQDPNIGQTTGGCGINERCEGIGACKSGLSCIPVANGANEQDKVCSLICGDGLVFEAREGCDDGNTTDGDGCDSNCQPSGCGNGLAVGDEACDDGNNINGDGCDSNCTLTICGNGIVTSGEECDDGNQTEGDGCDSNCTLSACGNGITGSNEECDDGNSVSGDGCDANCTLTVCGNGVMALAEECDDGNNIDGDGCDSNCRITGCGNGVITSGENCDDGNTDDTDGCVQGCLLARCGDGFTQDGVEECDDGNEIDTDACLSTCRAARCGDGFVGPGEDCDDSNALDTDGCTNACTIARCGDGSVREGVEECDDGNSIETDACLSTCRNARCGDGFVGPGEECDDRDVDNGDACLDTCHLARCGDGHIRIGEEQCDDGNEIDTDACPSTCMNARCGDGFIGPGEECDDGVQNSDQPGSMCRSNCRLAGCGDGILDRAEECDDGNRDDGDLCTNACTRAVCGDGTILRDIEECDDGNEENTDQCTNTCRLAACGDGITGPGEECDDGNAVEGDGCDSNCTDSVCGNGVLGPNEECDDGNRDNNDRCTNGCTRAVCGDRIVGPNEACDDGNVDQADGCTNECQLPVCGDGITGLGEECDDGNALDSDGCTNQCRLAICGDQIIGPREQCDDGNQDNDDICTNDCQLGIPLNCGDVKLVRPEAMTGVHDIAMAVNGAPYVRRPVYCDMDSFDGGWTRVARLMPDTMMWDAWSVTLDPDLDPVQTDRPFGFALSTFSADENGEDLAFIFHIDGQQVGPMYWNIHRAAWDEPRSERLPDGDVDTFDANGFYYQFQGEDPVFCQSSLVRQHKNWNWSLAGADGACASAGTPPFHGFVIHGAHPDRSQNAVELMGLGVGQRRFGEWARVEVFVRKASFQAGQAPEICNGLDDDEDGDIDEDVPELGVDCDSGALGECARGRTLCRNGNLECDPIRAPNIERCNGFDDDCDGVVDEGNPDAGAQCNTGAPGRCQAGILTCINGVLDCAQNEQPAAEACNGLDDDCDGEIDNGFDVGTVCERGVGVCQRQGQLVCNEAGVAQCSAVTVQPAAGESCNGLDDDCDGVVDEENPGGNCIRCDHNADCPGIQECVGVPRGCREIAQCGNGRVDEGEACDDGNGIDDDGCSNACELNLCGDGIVNGPDEECDDGNDSNDDQCTNECTRPNAPCTRSADGCPNLGFIHITGGDFQMGGGADNALPVHLVTVPTFQLMRTEVTEAHFAACRAAGACVGSNGASALPAVNVSWNEAQQFATWVGARLPSEAEWEYAARSRGQDIVYPWGNDLDCDRANYADCGAIMAGCSRPNGNSEQGVCDLAGNVWEMVQDVYSPNYDGAPADGSARAGEPGNIVMRGGSFNNDARNLPARAREQFSPDVRHPLIGFRLALTPPDGAECGNAILDGGEECDDGNDVNEDMCTNNCQFARCGDGIIGPDEECEDENQDNTDFCTNTCQIARCGDGIIGPGELCDDGNDNNADLCTNECTCMLGMSPECPAESCLEIIEQAPNDRPSGTYQLLGANQEPQAVWCEMDVDQGGWTQIYLSLENDLNSIQLGYTFDVQALRLNSSQAMIGYYHLVNGSVGNWAYFNLPQDWVRQAPMSYPGSQVRLEVVSEGFRGPIDLFYGYGDWDGGECGGFGGGVGRNGRVGLCQEGVHGLPYWTAFARDAGNHAGDWCNIRPSWRDRPCNDDIRFTIFVR